MAYRLFLIVMIPVSFVFMLSVVLVGTALMVAGLPVFAAGYVFRAPWSLEAFIDGYMMRAASLMVWVQDEMERA